MSRKDKCTECCRPSASENVLINLQKALSEAPEFNAALPSAAAVATAH